MPSTDPGGEDELRKCGNLSSGEVSSINGGSSNRSLGNYSTVSGGNVRTTPGEADWVAGGLFQDQ